MSPAADRGVAPLAPALILLVILSGRTSLSSSPLVIDAALGVPSANTGDGDNGAVSTTVGGTGSSTSKTRPTDITDDPQGRAPVIVGVDAPADSRDYASLIESAVDYWRADASTVAYDPAFVVRPNSSGSDVTVSVVERIDGCGGDAGADTAGCAPLLDDDDPTAPTEPVAVIVAIGYDNETTQMVLKREFGHLLGLTHGDVDASPVSSERVEMTQLPGPDTGKWESPLCGRAVTVHVDFSNVSPGERATHEAEIDHALSYYEDEADGAALANFSFECVSSPETVDVTFSVPAFRGDGSGMRWRRTGVDADDDAALEWYIDGDLVVDADLASSLVGWYVGAGLDYLFAADERANLLPPFHDGDPANDQVWRGLAGEMAGSVTTPVMTPWKMQEFSSMVRERCHERQ